MDSNGVYGAWEQGHLVLPDIDVIVNADGTSTVNLVDLGLSSAFFEDASVSEVSKNAAFGASQTFEATMTSSKETFSHLRMRMEHVGMDATYAITEASLDLSASSVSGTPLISVHPTNAPAWDEDAITWNRATSSQTWSDGGRATAGAATDAVEMSSTDSSLSLNITSAMQAHLQGSADESASFLLTSRGLNEAYTAGDAAVFHSSEAASTSDHPSLSITYRTTTATTSPAAPSLDAPSNGHAVWNLSGTQPQRQHHARLALDAAFRP